MHLCTRTHMITILSIHNCPSANTVLNKPTNVKIQGQTENSITVSWVNPDGNFDTVTLYCDGLDGANSDKTPYTNHEVSGKCENLTPVAAYNIIVEASLTDPSLPPSVNTSLVKAVTVPTQPTVSVVDVNTTAVKIRIEKGDGQCSMFKIINTGQQPTSPGQEIQIPCVSPVEHILNRLETNTQYKVDISTFSVNVSGVSVQESTKDSIQPWTQPSRLSAPAIVDIGSRWIQVNWAEAINNPSNVAFYYINVTPTGNPQGNKCVKVKGPKHAEANVVTGCTCNGAEEPQGLSVKITELSPFVEHSFTVTTVNPGQCSVESEMTDATTLQDIPGEVDNLIVLPYPNYMEVSWDQPLVPNGIITGYRVEWCNTGDAPKNPEAMSMNCSTEEVNTTEYTIEGLDAFQCYNISVAARTPIGFGDAIQGREEGEDEEDPCTKAGPPNFLDSASGSAISAFDIYAIWTLKENPQPTGNNTWYNVTATPCNSGVQKNFTRVEGFNVSSAVIEGLKPYEEYDVCVIAQTLNGTGGILSSEVEASHCFMTRTFESVPQKVENFEVRNGQDQRKCHTFSLSWIEPVEVFGDLQGYIVEYTKDGGASQNKTFGKVTSGEIDCLDSNNVGYTFKIRARNTQYIGAEEVGSESSGVCRPTQVPTTEVDGVKKSQSTITVQLNRCDLCYNSNGNVMFAAVIVTEKDVDSGSQDFDDMTAFNEVFKPFDSQNASVGYRATPDDWLNTIDCTGIMQTCRQNDPSLPGCPSSRARRATVPPVEFKVGDKQWCDNGPYCNKALKDGKGYRIRVAVQTSGGINVSPTSVVVVTDKNMGWIAGVVVSVAVVIVIIVIIIILRKHKKGPFRDKQHKAESSNLDLSEINKAPRSRPSPIPISRFINHVEQYGMLFKEEFKILKDMSPRHSTSTSELTKNRNKNRYSNVLAFDHSRVKMMPSSNDYINANHVPGHYSQHEFIATQGPMKTTTEDFWRMVWEQNVGTIVMVTQLEIHGREQCFKYWPDTNETMGFGSLEVHPINESRQNSYIIRTMSIRFGQQSRTITQFQYLFVPDFEMPQDPDSFVNFVLSIRSHSGEEHTSPTVVHCSSGSDSSAIFIAVDRLLQHISRDSDSVDIFGVILEMRNHRQSMVRDESQYILIHKCIAEAVQKGMIHHNTYQSLSDDHTSTRQLYHSLEHSVQASGHIYENQGYA